MANINIDVVQSVTQPSYDKFREFYEVEIRKDRISEEEVRRSWEAFKGKVRLQWMAEIDGETVHDAWLFEQNANAAEIVYKVITDISALLEEKLNKKEN